MLVGVGYHTFGEESVDSVGSDCYEVMRQRDDAPLVDGL